MVFLDRIRTLPPRRPVVSGGGSYSIGTAAMVYDELCPLDDDYSLYLVWNGVKQEDGVRSIEVVGFGDLRPRIRPEYFEAMRALSRIRFGDLVSLIRAVNTFQALGSEALPALRAYRDLCRALSFEDARKHGLDELLLVPVVQLLSAKPQFFPQDDSDVRDPGPGSWPRFPYCLEHDIPFLVSTGVSSVGPRPDVTRLLGADVVPRAAPLAPTLDPVEAAETLLTSPRWEEFLRFQSAGVGDRQKKTIRRQAIETLAPVYRPPDEFRPKSCCGDPSEAEWRQIVEEVRALGVHWDPAHQEFIRSR